MPLYGPSSGTVTATHRPTSPVAAINRVPCSIYPRELNENTYASTGAQLGAATVDTATALHRQRTHATWGVNDLSLVYGNYNNTNGAGESNTSVAITVIATIEYPQGTFHPLTFNGASSIAIQPNQTAVSDPLAIVIPPNTYFYTRTFWSVPAPSQVSAGIPVGPYAGPDLLNNDTYTCGDNALGHSSGAGTNQTQTSGTSWVTGIGYYSYGPLACIGTPLNTTKTVVAGIIGDSISDFTADNQDGGFIARALFGANIAFYRLSRGNEGAANFSVQSARMNRMLRIAACSTIIHEYGTNDLAGNTTFATLRSNVLSVLGACGGYGATVWVTTITPRTTSTDSWATATNQTVITTNTNGYNTQRLLYNAYVRAPASAGAGNSLAYDLAAQGTSFGGFIDVAKAVETTSANTVPSASVISGADRWYVPGGVAPTLDGIHPNQSTHINILQPLMPVASFT